MINTYIWVIEKLPIWFRIELSNIGITQCFSLDDLTAKQMFQFDVILALFNLVEKGKITAEVREGIVVYKKVKEGVKTEK